MDKTVVKAFQLLELLVLQGRPSGVTELAVAMGLQKSNVHRLLQTLFELRYVRPLENGLYEPNLRLWEFGQRVFAQIDVARVAHPEMLKLADATGESVHLASLGEEQVIYLDKIGGANPVRAFTEVGGRSPAYCTATGKALLAYQGDEVVKRIMKNAVQHTPATITDPDELFAELKRVRDQGYAKNVGEHHVNVAGLAAPIFDGRNGVIAAVGISCPVERLTTRALKAATPIVVDSAKNISIALGAVV